MNRRRFFAKLGIAGGGLAAGLARPLNLFAAGGSARGMSLTMGTDQPDRAIGELQKLLGNAPETPREITFREAVLPGRQMSDVVLVRGGELIDFRSSSDPFARRLNRFATGFHLPR